MTDSPANGPVVWSRRRWWTWVGSLFFLQVVFVFALSSRQPALEPVRRPPAHLSLLTPSGAALPEAMPAWLDDPAQVALVSVRGFSGPTWRRLPRLETPLLSWTDPPQWLNQDVTRLAVPRAFERGDRAIRHRVVLVPPQPWVGGAVLPPAPPSPRSTLTVEGDLARRRQLDVPELPTWPHPDVLMPTAVQTVVDRDGLVLSATLLTRSGLAAADQKALDLARAAHFEPIDPEARPSPLTWGQLIYRWQATPPATNAP